jgi:hypothetical protein
MVLLLPNSFILFGFPIFRFWTYPMKVIPETRRAPQNWNIGKPNNLKVFGSNKTKGPKQDIQKSFDKNYIFRNFYCSQTLLYYLAFQSFDFERTRWRLFQKRVVCTKFDIYFFFHYAACLFNHLDMLNKLTDMGNIHSNVKLLSFFNNIFSFFF